MDRISRTSLSTFMALTSLLTLLAAVLIAGTALFCHWGVNAGWLGAHDAGAALSLSLIGAVALVVASYAAPVLVIVDLALLILDRNSTFRILAAGAACAVPVLALTWLERM